MLGDACTWLHFFNCPCHPANLTQADAQAAKDLAASATKQQPSFPTAVNDGLRAMPRPKQTEEALVNAGKLGSMFVA